MTFFDAAKQQLGKSLGFWIVWLPVLTFWWWLLGSPSLRVMLAAIFAGISVVFEVMHQAN